MTDATLGAHALHKLVGKGGGNALTIVEFGEILIAGQDNNNTLTLATTVDLNKAALSVQSRAYIDGGGTYEDLAEQAFVLVRFTDNQTVEAWRTQSDTATEVAVRFVAFEAGQGVQVVDDSFTGQSADYTINAVDPAKTLVFVSARASFGTQSENRYSAEVIDATTLRVSRDTTPADGGSLTFVAYVIEFA